MIKHRLVRLLIHEGSAEQIHRAKQQREVKQFQQVTPDLCIHEVILEDVLQPFDTENLQAIEIKELREELELARARYKEVFEQLHYRKEHI